MDKEQIELVEEPNLFQPLDPNLNYYDATGSIEAMATCMRGMYDKICELENALVVQASINTRVMQELAAHKAQLSKPKSPIIMPGRG